MGFRTRYKNGSAHIQLLTRAMNDAVLRADGLYTEGFVLMYFWVGCCFFKKHFEAVHVLCVCSGVAELSSVEKSILNLLIHPLPDR